jgi:hypothetical protein
MRFKRSSRLLLGGWILLAYSVANSQQTLSSKDSATPAATSTAVTTNGGTVGTLPYFNGASTARD